MEWQINQDNFELDYFLKSAFTIKILRDFPKILKFINIIKIPPAITNELYLLSIPIDHENIFLDHYSLIEEQNPYRPIGFSLDDFILAYIAAENNWGVVSYDHHLLDTIHKYLEFDSYYPSEICHLPSDSLVMLDTNILYSFSDSRPKIKEEIVDMVDKNPNITFLIPHSIINEAQKLYKAKNISQQDVIEINLEEKEYHLAQFIDDFNGFISPNSVRKKLKEKKRKKSHRYPKNKLRGRWEKNI